LLLMESQSRVDATGAAHDPGDPGIVRTAAQRELASVLVVDHDDASRLEPNALRTFEGLSDVGTARDFENPSSCPAVLPHLEDVVRVLVEQLNAESVLGNRPSTRHHERGIATGWPKFARDYSSVLPDFEDAVRALIEYLQTQSVCRRWERTCQ